MDRHYINADLADQGLEGTDRDIALEVVVAAFGWAILRRMGVRKFPNIFIIHQPDGERGELNVADAHLFVAALGIALDLFENGYTPSLSKEGVFGNHLRQC